MLLSFLLFAVSEEWIHPEAELNADYEFNADMATCVKTCGMHGGSMEDMGDFPSMALMI